MPREEGYTHRTNSIEQVCKMDISIPSVAVKGLRVKAVFLLRIHQPTNSNSTLLRNYLTHDLIIVL